MSTAVLTILIAEGLLAIGGPLESPGDGTFGQPNYACSQCLCSPSCRRACCKVDRGLSLHKHVYTRKYPPFHGTHYRRPINYRNLLDYPWHARMQAPVSSYEYAVPTEEFEAVPIDKATRRVNDEPPKQASEMSPAASHRRHLPAKTTGLGQPYRLRPLPVEFAIPAIHRDR